jgi:catechol 2,3-dioxygenase-like lactoylglutathione lyase family enzyme
MAKKINGIQQLGIGVANLHEAWEWYRTHFNMDIEIFEEEAIAELMLPHTEGIPRARHAVLALNMQGGGGFEIWQHLGHEPREPAFILEPGDLGIFAGKMKTFDAAAAYQYFIDSGLNLLSSLQQDPSGRAHFFLLDPYGNLWQFVEEKMRFRHEKQSVSGGTYGVVIGVNDIEASIKVYRDLLEYDMLVYDESGSFSDLGGLPGGDARFRRVLLRHSQVRTGAMSPFFGPTEIELIQCLDRPGRSIYEGRMWGDLGFIHICFDVNHMDDLREETASMGYPFTVDSARHLNTFDMGEAAGSFAYIQAPEGTLIEFVETHRVPIVKALGWYLNFRRRGHRPLPRWILHLFALKRVK